VVVDAGGGLQPPRAARDGSEVAQRRAKAALILASLAEADAVAFAASDWALGGDWLRQQIAQQGVPLLAGNLTCGDDRYPAHRVVEVGGRRVGIVGVAVGEVEGCEVAPPGPALEAAVASLGPVDATIALLPVTGEAQVASLVGEVPLTTVFSAAGRYDAQGPTKVGSSWSFGAGTRGKYVGVLELAFVPGGRGWAPVGVADELEERRNKLQARLDSLEARVAAEADPARKEAFAKQVPRLRGDLAEVQAEIAGLGSSSEGLHQLRPSARDLSRAVVDDPAWAGRVEALNVELSTALASLPPIVARTGPDGSDYLGADACAACHEAEARQWSTTPHARALATLAADNHAADEGCVRCHVTGYGQAGGPASPLEVGGLRDVQCEACHGPGRAHVASPHDVPPPQAPTEATCRGCHDNENDMGRFDPASYLPKVRHGGADSPPRP